MKQVKVSIRGAFGEATFSEVPINVLKSGSGGLPKSIEGSDDFADLVRFFRVNKSWWLAHIDFVLDFSI
jgi:hypothetical protein